MINYTRSGGEISGLTILANCQRHHHSVCDRVKPWLTVSVPCDTLSNVLARHRTSEVDFFSLDVEGHETEVLLSLRNRSAIKVLVAEAGPPEKDKQVRALLAEAGLHRQVALEMGRDPRNHVFVRRDVQRACLPALRGSSDRDAFP